MPLTLGYGRVIIEKGGGETRERFLKKSKLIEIQSKIGMVDCTCC